MVLHTVFCGNTVGASTGSGTQDTIASTGFRPTGDNEVQARGGGIPTWIGIDSYSSEIVQIGATSALDYIQVSLNTDTQAQYLLSHYRKTTMGAAAKFGNMIEPGVWWFDSDVMLEQDADWTVKLANTTGSQTNLVALYESYGAKIPTRGGRIISRKVVFTSDDSAWPTFTAGPAITDLDPRLTYRVAGIQGLNVEDHELLACRVTSASNNTYAGALVGTWTATTFHVNTHPTWFPKDSILVSGVESVVVECASNIAQKPSVAIFFEEYGSSGSMTAGATRAQTPTGGGVQALGGQTFGGQGGFLGGLFGGR